MKLLVDMNLSPEWVAVLKEAGWETEHWSKVGDPRAADSEIMAWATKHGHVVFTHDLDFGSLLALDSGRKTKRHSGSHSRCDARRDWQTRDQCAAPISN
jgi:predicted nuclease of predicted toxin-antitoxin system